MRVLLSDSEIRHGVVRMAAEISQCYAAQPLTILAVLTGSVVLLADLIRLLQMPLRVGVLQASSYRGGTTRGELVINHDLMPDLADRHVLLVDDIFDTGHTLQRIVELLQKMEPKSIRTAVLLRKTGRQEVPLLPDFIGFEIPNEFVVGYGLDYQDAYRNLPCVVALSESDIAQPPQDFRQELTVHSPLDLSKGAADASRNA